MNNSFRGHYLTCNLRSGKRLLALSLRPLPAASRRLDTCRLLGARCSVCVSLPGIVSTTVHVDRSYFSSLARTPRGPGPLFDLRWLEKKLAIYWIFTLICPKRRWTTPFHRCDPSGSPTNLLACLPAYLPAKGIYVKSEEQTLRAHGGEGEGRGHLTALPS